MAGHTHGRSRLRRAVVPAVLLASLALSACEEKSDQLAPAGAGATPSAPTTNEGDGRDGKADRPVPTAAPDDAAPDDAAPDDAAPDESSEDGGSSSEESSYAVEPPGPFNGLSRSDVLITATESLPDNLVDRIRTVKGVETALPISVGSASIDGRTLMVAAVDPGSFRQFTPDVTARADWVWDRVAGGEVAVDTDLDKRLIDKQDMIRLGSGEDAPEVHVGAIAPLIKRSAGTPAEQPVIQAVVNEKRGEQIGIQQQNAILVDTGQYTPSELEDEFKKILGDVATMQVLALEFKNFGQVAALTGQSVPDAVGTFTYTNGPDGTIVPDQGWVKEYIRTEFVPILGDVTCNKGVLPQLRGALTQIELEGLSSEIKPEQYAGCYYPRYIGRDPSNGLSMHSWGIAVDLNVPTNLMGTEGDMHPRVVEIFKLWGFAWGGDWNYTDPMHFEMAEVVRPEVG